MTKQHKPKLPDLKTREELAEFWDTHDITDYLHELKPVEMKYHKDLSQGITVRLDEETLNILREKAAAKSIKTTTLIRMWLVERLYQERYERTS